MLLDDYLSCWKPALIPKLVTDLWTGVLKSKYAYTLGVTRFYLDEDKLKEVLWFNPAVFVLKCDESGL